MILFEVGLVCKTKPLFGCATIKNMDVLYNLIINYSLVIQQNKIGIEDDEIVHGNKFLYL